MSVAEMVESLSERGRGVDLDGGHVLCREGDESVEAYIVLTGQLDALIDVAGAELLVGSHQPGALVGEITTVLGGTRTATLRANGATTVGILGKETLVDWLDRHPETAGEVLAAARERTDRTRVAALLSGLLGAENSRLAAAIAQSMEWRSIEAGDELFARGDRADSAYLLVSGRLASDGPEGWRAISRGEVIGTAGLFESSPRRRSVRAVRDCSLGRLTAEEFVRLAAEYPREAVDLTWRFSTSAGNIEPARGLARSLALMVTADASVIDAPSLVSTMVGAIAERATVAHLSPDGVADLLGRTGIADVDTGGFGEVRLAELLHQAEVEHDAVVFDGTAGGEQWSGRVLRYADQVVVVCSPSPDRAEETRIRSIVESVGGRVPVWLAVVHPVGQGRPRDTPALRARFGVDEVHHLRHGRPEDLGRVGRLAVGRGVALVLSGGGGRGFAHLGVFRSLHQLGVPVDRIVGASMGAVIAAVIAQGLEGEELFTVVEEQFRGLLDYTVPLVSVLKGERIEANVTGQFGDWDFEDLWTPFACVSTNLTRSRIEEHRRGPLPPAIRASIAIPGILPPVPQGEDLLIDGGVLDNLPIDLVKDDDSIGTIIAVDVSPPTGPRAKSDFGLSVSGWAAMMDRVRPGRSRLPSLSSILMRSVSVSAARARDEHVAKGAADLYLDLDLGGVGLLEFEKVRPVAERGYEAAHPRLVEWLGT